MATATTISLEEYLTRMQPHIATIASLAAMKSRRAGTGVLLEKEDLEQCAREKLLDVYARYRSTVPEHELCAVGVQSIKNLTQDLVRRSQSTTRGGVGRSVIRKTRPLRETDQPVKHEDVDQYGIKEWTGDAGAYSENPRSEDTPSQMSQEPQQLDRLLFREKVKAVTDALSEVEQRTLRGLLESKHPERFRSASFKSLQRKMRAA